MADITTNLNKRPYFDDYAENKEFYRILFKPGTAVQARELTQLQTILQKQISRFGSHVFKNGSVVDGVNPDFVRNANVVRIKNAFSNNSQVDINSILSYSNNLTVESQTTGLTGRLIFATDGSEAAKPDTKRLYVTYNGVDTSQTKTTSGTLAVTNGSNTITGTSTSFTSYEVGDAFTVFETADRGKVAFTTTIASIANNESMDVNRVLTFSNSSIASSNYVIHEDITTFGQIGTDASPEILDLTALRVNNSQSNTVNTSISSTVVNLGFTVANTALLEVSVNDELQTIDQDYTASATTITFNVALDNGDEVDVIEKERVVAFSGLRIFSDTVSGTVGSEPAMIARNDDGIIYHKGQFLNIDAGFAVIADNLDGANNAQVVVRSDESIVTFKADQSLLDNAAGFSNEAAPGADRLKLNPSLASANGSTLANESGVATLLEFNNEGNVLRRNVDPQYAELGRQLAIMTDDHAGSYTVKRFPVRTRSSGSDNTFFGMVGAGTGYIDGYRIQTLDEQQIEIDRGTAADEFDDQEVIINYGQTIRVKGLVGHPHIGLKLNFFKTAAGGNPVGAFADNSQYTDYQAVTSANDAVPTTCFRVGGGVISNVSYVSGTPGTEDAEYDIALYDIETAAGQDITTARSVGFRRDTDASAGLPTDVTFIADIVTIDSLAQLSETNTLPFASYGVEGMKRFRNSSGTLDNDFRARMSLAVTDSFASSGDVSIDIDDDTRMTYGTKNVGALTDAELNGIIITNVGSEIFSDGASATAAANTVTVATADMALINVGDVIQITGDATQAVVLSKDSATDLTIDRPITATGTLKKILQAGKVLNITSSMVTTNQVNNTIDVSYPPLSSGTWGGSTTVMAIVDADASNVEEAALDIEKDQYWVFNTNTHTNENVGPWNMEGAVNIHKITGVWVLPNVPAANATHDGVANTTVTESDLTSLKNYVDGGLFQTDSGQRDFFIKEGALELTNKGLRQNLLDNDSTLIVRADVLKANLTAGAGFVTVDSYPTTTNNTAGPNEILLEEIPTYVASDGREVDLRDVIDFRPTAPSDLTNHVDLATAQSNINAAHDDVLDGFNSNHRFSFTHNTEFTTDYEVYQTARVNLYIERNGDLATTRVASIDKQAPTIPDALLLATIGVPALPSLTAAEATALADTNRGGKLSAKNVFFSTEGKEMSIEQFNVRGYTMKDIGALARRIDNLEYYTSLSNLESGIFNKQFKNDSGIDRFKNGFFVDPMISHQFGNIDNPEYSVNIDKERTAMVPTQDAEYVSDYEHVVQSGPVNRFGPRIMFNHTETSLISQPRATKVRPAAPLAIRFSGTVELFPSFDAGVDKTVSSEIIINQDQARPRGGVQTIAGPWRTTRTNRTGRNVTTTTQRNIRRVETTVTESLERTGEMITDVTLNPFIREQIVFFNARGLRPATEHSVFFNRQNVDQHVAPGIFSTISPVDQLLGRTQLRDINNTSQRILGGITGRYGDAVVADANGNARGFFRIPAGEFLQGDREFFIADTDNLTVGEDSILSSAKTMFHSNRIGAESTVEMERTFDIERTVTDRTQQRRTQRRTGGDPIAQSFTVPASQTTHIFISSLDLFFKTRGTHPVQVYVCEMEAGQPETSRIVGGSRKFVPAAKINISDNASAATTFTFKHPIRLKTGTSYAFVVKPDLDDPDYDVWFSELGGIDVSSGLAVNQQPIGGIAFMGANQESWTKLQDEDIKFNMKRAVFSTGTGVVRFTPEAKDFMKFEDITFLNGNSSARVGDIVFGMDSATGDPAVVTANIDNTMFGIIQDIDELNNTMTIAPSTGGWTSSAMTVFSETLRDGTTRNTDKYKVAIYRSRDSRIDANTYDDTLFVGSTFVELVDHEFSTIQTSWTTNEFKNSTVSLTMNYNASNTVSQSIDLPAEGEIDYYKKALRYRSLTNDQGPGGVGSAFTGRSFYIDATMTNSDDYTSPMIDLRRTTNTLAGWNTLEKSANTAAFNIGATIDDETKANLFSEMFVTAGETNNRYISRTVTLADEQDAEDMKVFLTAFKPPKSDIEVFVRAAQAYEDINEKLFSPMKLINPDAVSNREDENDTVELEYGFYTRAELDATDFVTPFTSTDGQYAYEFTRNFTDQSMLALNNSTNIVEYESDGSTFTTYKTFEIKIVFYATPGTDPLYATKRTANPPMVYDVRAVALQT